MTYRAKSDVVTASPTLTPLFDHTAVEQNIHSTAHSTPNRSEVRSTVSTPRRSLFYFALPLVRRVRCLESTPILTLFI